MSNRRKPSPKVKVKVARVVHQITPDDLPNLNIIIPRLVNQIEERTSLEGVAADGPTVKIMVEQEFIPKEELRNV